MHGPKLFDAIAIIGFARTLEINMDERLARSTMRRVEELLVMVKSSHFLLIICSAKPPGIIGIQKESRR
jgi:hypothetical protein